MSWIKLDDRMPEHPKVVGLSDRAFRAHIEALCYCAGTHTDGVVTEAIAKKRGWLRSAAALVEALMWEPREGGWYLHNFLKYQRSKEDVDRLSDLRAEAGSRGGKSTANAKQIAEPLLKQIRSEEIRDPNPTDSVTPKRGRAKPELTEEARTAFRARWVSVATADEVNEQITLALSHKSAKNYDRIDLYVGNWLRRSFEGRNNGSRGGGSGAQAGRPNPGANGRGNVGGGGQGRNAPRPAFDLPPGQSGGIPRPSNVSAGHANGRAAGGNAW